MYFPRLFAVIAILALVAVGGLGYLYEHARADAGDRIPLTRGEAIEQEDGTFLIEVDGKLEELTDRELRAAERKAAQTEKRDAAATLEQALADIKARPSANPDIARLENALLLLMASGG